MEADGIDGLFCDFKARMCPAGEVAAAGKYFSQKPAKVAKAKRRGSGLAFSLRFVGSAFGRSGSANLRFA